MNTFTVDTLPPDDRQLVERHLDGDRAAFAEIVKRHQAAVCAVTFSACGDMARSEDLAQEVFLRAWQKLPDLREAEKLRAWLCGLARNVAREAWRRDAHTPTAGASELGEEIAGDDDPRARVIASDNRALMWHLLEGIPEVYREPLVLYYREQRSTAAVAGALQISEETVRQRLARGRAMLGERMEAVIAAELDRGAPTQVFTASVLAALPATAATGSLAGKAASGASIGAAIGKAGLGAKLLAGAGLLPPLLNALDSCLGYRASLDAAKTPEMRRAITRVHLGFYVSLAVQIALIGVLILARPFLAGWLFAVLLVAAIVLPILSSAIWAKKRWQRETASRDPAQFHAEMREVWTAARFEYRSPRTLLGLPLVHVRLSGSGSMRQWRQPVRAWIAIGDSAMGGLFASGAFAIAPISVGPVAIGVFSFGALVIGGFAVGGMAIGLFAAGGMAAGFMAAGGMAWPVVVNERFQHLAEYALHASGRGWTFAWVAPLLFVGWTWLRNRRVAN